jgi:hypothetical protein
MHGVTSPSKCDRVDSIREAAASAGSVQKLNVAYNIVIVAISAKAMGLQKVCGAV